MSAPLSTPGNQCFALLDDSSAPENAPRSRLYTGHAETLTCAEPGQLEETLARMQQALQQGLHAVAVFPYELGEMLHAIEGRDAPPPSARILLFRHCSRLAPDELEHWLVQQTDATQLAGIVQTRVGIDESAFVQALSRIHAYIEAGDTYQVNFTYRLHFSAYGPVTALYRKLRRRQPVPYGALIALPDGGALLSLSPELFLRHEAGKLTAQPMKGTAPATGDLQRDKEQAANLAADEKSRAENVMIVDLLRNDLGRVAIPGSVRVPRLFEVTRFGGVLQMTSTITAELRKEITLAELIRAVYPCGSITGAPKRRTMQIIRELESERRGVYTGAIGWFDSPVGTETIGDFCLSVPIRTLELEAPDQDGLRKGEMGVGAGIVYDSVTQQEYEECRLKGRFLTGLIPDFELFETMAATREKGVEHLARHLQRLRASAEFFNFLWNEDDIRAAVSHACEALASGLIHRLRLSLDPNGRIAMQSAPLVPLTSPVHLLRSATSMQAQDLFLRHKTTVRPIYDAAWRAAEQQGAFDTLFCNQHGHVTEGGRSSLFARIGGRWFTPPLSAGLLPGVMRAVLLDDPEWNAEERNLSWDDLRRADKIIACNALRGAMDAQIDWDVAPVSLTV